MLFHIVPQYFNELYAEQRAGRTTLDNLAGAIRYARDVVSAGFARNVARQHGLDFRQLLPASLKSAPADIQQLIREFPA